MEEVEIRTVIMYFEEGVFGGKPLWKDKGSLTIDPQRVVNDRSCNQECGEVEEGCSVSLIALLMIRRSCGPV